MDWTNADRAKRGEAIRDYLAGLYEVDRDDNCWLQDTLADLMHAKVITTDELDRAVRLANLHYEDERDADPRPKCGAPACIQGWIEDGRAECVCPTKDENTPHG